MSEKKVPPPLPSAQNRPALQQQEEQYEEEIPTDVVNGETLAEQTVAPDCYRWYNINVEGHPEDDIVSISISRTLRAGAVNIFVNYPPSENYPTKDSHDWNPTLGPLQGPPGVYRLSMQGVRSFIEKDDKWLVDPNSNWATFDLYVEWNLLDEDTKERYKKVREEYTLAKRDTVWSSSYSKELQQKYRELHEQMEKERQELEAKHAKQEINLDGTVLAQKYDLGETLGRSPFSHVRVAKEKSSGKEFAVKIIDKEEAALTGIKVDTLKRQGDLLKDLQHPNIVAFQEAIDLPQAYSLVTEKVAGEAIVHLGQAKTYTEATARTLVVQLLQAIQYLHSKGIVHSSLMLGNLLSASKDSIQLKLAGFTFAHKEAKDQEKVSGGDPAFQAPEIVNREPWGKEVDLWQVGIVTYILLVGVPPFTDKNPIALAAKIRQGSYNLPATLSNEAKEFIQQLLNVDPKKRPTADAALALPWIKSSSAADLASVQKSFKELTL